MREVRLGAHMSVLKARILDAIRRSGPDGIAADELHGLVGCRSRAALKSHIAQLNDLLVATDFRIRCGKGGRRYVLTSQAKQRERF
jgi:hypothetical protein